MGTDRAMNVRVPSDTLSSAGRAAHDLALAALIGGNLFGRVAMHPALTSVSDQSERGRVLNRAWRRYGTVNSLALLTLVSGWLGERRRVPQRRAWWPVRRSPGPEQRVRDVALGAVLITGVASALSGIGFAQQAPKGAVPMRSGSEPSPDATRAAAVLKHAVNTLGALNLASELVLVAVSSATDGHT